jgi:NADPH:quinone reductase-like Zn-dependent oxidoreductase
MSEPRKGLELRTRISSSGVLELALHEADYPAPTGNQVIVRMEAAPINPSDLALLFGPAELSTARREGDRLVATVPTERLRLVQGRLDQWLPAGNEGAGTVIEAGDAARDLVGKRVSIATGGTYAQLKAARATDCMLLPDGVSPAQGAAAFINPMTALSMVEAMRREGHTGLVHTAAASNLGQMLVRICAADGVPLVNIVRRDEQVVMLKNLGATYVLDSSTSSFHTELTEALAATGATIAFDALGGGSLASTILSCMEAAALRKATVYSRYGTNVHKQVYVYGRLDLHPLVLGQDFGLAWGVSGFLVSTFLAKAGPETYQRLRTRVLAELTTTFASHFDKTISLREVLEPEIARDYAKRATGKKYLVEPTK